MIEEFDYYTFVTASIIGEIICVFIGYKIGRLGWLFKPHLPKDSMT